MRFFDRFRTELGRYAEGVHPLEPPAALPAIASAERRLGRAFPSSFRDFLGQWNGGYLFHDDYALFGVAGAARDLDRLEATPDLLLVGTGPVGPFGLDARGRVVAIDESTQVRRIEGSEFERWLDAVMARERLVFDREGEVRAEALDGVELAPRIVRKRAEVAIKIDSQAPAWHEELGQLLYEVGEGDRAEACFRRVVELDPEAAGAWFALGKLLRSAAKMAAASRAFRAAGEAESEPAESAIAFAHAARTAREAYLVEADGLAERAARAQPSFVAEQRAAAEHLLAEGAVEEAIEHLELALAVVPNDADLAALRARTRARLALRPV